MQILTIQFVSRSQKQTCQVLKNIMRQAGPRISRLAPNAQMWPSVVRSEFFVGVWPTSSSRKLYFNLEKGYLRQSETLKQQITTGLGETKGDISEI